MDTTTLQLQKQEGRRILPGHYFYSDVLAVSVRTPPQQIHRSLNFAYKSTDIVLATFPRSGTLLTQEIIWQVKNRNTISLGGHYGPMSGRFPYIEQAISETTGIEVLSQQAESSFRLVKTHLPWFLLGPALKKASNPPCKVVVVMRNPKDVAVSLFQFYKLFTCYSDWPNQNWTEFLSEFLNGNTMYGDYFDWNLGWWRADYSTQNILYLKYEDIIKNSCGMIKKLAEFLDESSISEAQLKIIANNVLFENMESNSFVNMEMPAPGSKMMRKGIIGGWKELFSQEQSNDFDRVIQRRFQGTSLNFEYL